MPYIRQDQRVALENQPAGMLQPGDLNYMVTKLIQKYCSNRGINYQTINDVIGALEGAKLEFYRRVAIQYEDSKIKENGDVY
jgi:predicted DNA-binding protein with PD1-like motif